MNASVIGSPRSGGIVTASSPTSTDAGTEAEVGAREPSSATASFPRVATGEGEPGGLGLHQQVVPALRAELRAPLGLGPALRADHRERELLPAAVAELRG